MANGKSKEVPAPALAFHDFYKTNGVDYVFFTEGASLTRQEFAEECDINSIMKRYEGHNTGPGGLPNVNPAEPFYADFTSMPTDLLGYMTAMTEAEAAFMTLPAGVRREFNNSPFEFVAFASDPENLPQMRTWGLAPPAKAPDLAGGSGSASPPADPPPAAPAAGGAGKPA